MRALVTGATGLVGSHVVRALLQRGGAVRVLLRPSSDTSAIDGLDVERCVGDVLDPATLRAAVSGCGTVFHAAAHFSYWGLSDAELNTTALAGTSNVLEAAAAAGVRRVTVTSSSVVFGSSGEAVLRDERSVAGRDEQSLQNGEQSRQNDEQSRQNVLGVPYIESKIRQHHLALDRGRELGLEVVLVCPTVVVGPCAARLGPSNAVLTAYLEDPFRLTFPGGANVVSAADVGRAHVLLSAQGETGEAYIVGGENLEWPALHAMVSELCGTAGPFLTVNHTQSYVAAFVDEVRARLVDRAPATTRTQASMVGRYFWYSHAKAGALGYRPVPARAALATALSWLVASRHISREARTRLLMSGEVWAARRQLSVAEAALRIRA
jgi:dihydroflavonol-4-reductase